MANKLNKRRKQFARMKKKPNVPNALPSVTTDISSIIEEVDADKLHLVSSKVADYSDDVLSDETQQAEKASRVELDVDQKPEEARVSADEVDHSVESAAGGQTIVDDSVESDVDVKVDRHLLVPNKVELAHSDVDDEVNNLQLVPNKVESADSCGDVLEAFGKLQLADETMESAEHQISNVSVTDNLVTGSGYQAEDEHNCVSSDCTVVPTGTAQQKNCGVFSGHAVDVYSRSEPQLTLADGFPRQCHIDDLSTTSSECDSTSTKLTTTSDCDSTSTNLTTSSEVDTDSSTTLTTSCTASSLLSSSSLSSSSISTTTSSGSSYHTSTGTKKTDSWSDEDSDSELSTSDASSAGSADTYYTSKSTSSA